MILHTGGSACGDISTKSKLACAAAYNASASFTTPFISPSAPTRRTSGDLISLLAFGNLLLRFSEMILLHLVIMFCHPRAKCGDPENYIIHYYWIAASLCSSRVTIFITYFS